MYAKFICTLDCTKYCQEHLPQACPYNDAYKARSSRRLKMQPLKKPGNKIKILKTKPNYGQNLYQYYLKLLLVPCFKFFPREHLWSNAKIAD